MKLNENEAIIEEALLVINQQWWLIGERLADIQEEGDWNVGGNQHKRSFWEYCEQRWNWVQPRVSQLIGAAKIHQIFDQPGPIGQSPNQPITMVMGPTSERQARPLTRISNNPELVKRAWALAKDHAEIAGKPVTAKDVSFAVDLLKGNDKFDKERRIPSRKEETAKLVADFLTDANCLLALPFEELLEDITPEQWREIDRVLLLMERFTDRPSFLRVVQDDKVSPQLG